MIIRAHGLTDVGRRRDQNEDALCVDPEHGLYAVADGMGGHAAGEIAAAIAIETLHEAFRNGVSERAQDETGATRRLELALGEGNRRIWASMNANADRRGMGTTIVVMLLAGPQAIIAHVGDSRAYLLRGDRVRRLTSDHSWVNEQVKMGLMTDEDAQHHPLRNIVTRALGSREEVISDMAIETVERGDVFLLCSDGLNTMISDDEIGRILRRHRADPETACHELVRASNENGGEDNITVVVVVAE